MAAPQTEVLITVDGSERGRYLFAPGDYIIGREEGCHIRVEADLVSRRHAKLVLNYDNAFIEDLGSSNGTRVNGQPVTEATRLWPNQKIQVGAATIELRRLKVEVSDQSLMPTQAVVRRVLPEEFLKEKKYDIGKVVAQGGMGAILDAKEATIERTVAMKVMLDTNDPDALARFLNEAKITGQLEHPNIVPVHELSVDENGQPYYTMKMVRGITLKKVLELMAAGTEATVKKYPLAALLTIFQKVCDAIAFAHSRGVIHRDLKPENIMLGDYGEVLVMDWGLAKVLGESSATDASRSAVRLTIPGGELRSADSTMAGTILGTPQFMAPEQARGEVDMLDARSDIYSLGAILYQILALRVSVTGTDALEVIGKVARGEIEALRSLKSGNGNPHANIPDSLAAVVRKAMALDRDARYATVAELQRDIAAYQSGFATGAEKAGVVKQITLLVKRHKGIFSTAAVAWLIITVLAVWFVIDVTREKTRAERNYERALEERYRAENALDRLKKTAPALLALAASEAGLQRFDSALEKADAALATNPSLAEARWRRGWVLFAQGKLDDSLAALREAAERDPANGRHAALLPLVEKLVQAPAERRQDFELIKPLYDHLTAVGAVGEATPLLPHLKLGNDARMALVKERIEHWLGKPAASTPALYFVGLDKGKLLVSLNGIHVGSLEALRGLPIDSLSTEGCGLTSLEPLRGMRLVTFIASRNAIEDLGPLEGMPLEFVNVMQNPLTDLSPLRGMHLKAFFCSDDLHVSDLRPLAGMPLEELQVQKCPVGDFSVLRGMPLKKLRASQTSFADGRVLVGMPLAELDLNNCNGFSDASTLAGLPLHVLKGRNCTIGDFTPLLRIPTLESLETTAPNEKLLPLRAHPGLKQIKAGDSPYCPVAEFWKKCDAQQAAGKK